jgi:biotin carboxyl carrier protein
MKIRVTVDGRAFEVDVADIRARPVIAVVEGERFEVWPETLASLQAQGPGRDNGRAAEHDGVGAASGPEPPVPVLRPTRFEPAPAQPGAGASGAILAPIPGVILSVAVQAGQSVSAGQEICMLEAMKMQNAIRAPRDGVIATMRVSAGQHVRHREVLAEYQES